MEIIFKKNVCIRETLKELGSRLDYWIAAPGRVVPFSDELVTAAVTGVIRPVVGLMLLQFIRCCSFIRLYIVL